MKIDSFNSTPAEVQKTMESPVSEISMQERSSSRSLVPVKTHLPITENSFSFLAAIAQLYRDRATCENNFDELKNQWGWGGFVTQDIFRSQVTARIVTLIYNWWTLFTRWIDPTKHREGITSRPLMLHGVGRQITHAGKTTIKITSLHGKRNKVEQAIALVHRFLENMKKYAQQKVSKIEKWCLILSEIFKEQLRGRILSVPSG